MADQVAVQLPVLSTGSSVASAELVKQVNISDVVSHIRTGANGLANLQKSLRSALQLDKKLYDKQKIALPYFAGSTFVGNKREVKNLVAVNYFVLDIDGLPSADVLPIFNRLISDARLLLGFISPSGKGIKLVFRLQEPIFDAAYYAKFYKIFAQQYAAQQNLAQYLDTVTSDAARICFLAHHPEAYFNPKAEPIISTLYLDANTDFFSLPAAEPTPTPEPAEKRKENAQPIAEEVMKQIIATLNPKYKPQRGYEPYCPEIIEGLVPEIATWFSQVNVLLTEAVTISYGKTLRFENEDQLKAEINLFYSQKKGFSVVKMPKKGTHPVFSEHCHRFLSQILVHN